jgi:hypothetical protein
MPVKWRAFELLGSVDSTDKREGQVVHLRIYLLASAVFMLLINAAPLPATAAESVKLASVDACSLLTPAELSAVVGVPMVTFPFTGRTLGCWWMSHPTALINVHLGLFTFSKRIFEQQKHLAGQENVTDVSGFGDDAYYAQIGPETYLNVKKGDIEVQVAWSGTTDHQTVMDGEKTIAAQVLSEL